MKRKILLIQVVIFLLNTQIVFGQPQRGGSSFSFPEFVRSINFDHNVDKSVYFYYQKYNRDYQNVVVKADGAVHFPVTIKPRMYILGGGYHHSLKINNSLSAIGTLNLELITTKYTAQIPYYLWFGLRYQIYKLSLEPVVKIMLNKYVTQRISGLRFNIRYKNKLDKITINSSVSLGFHPKISEKYSIDDSGTEILYFFSISRNFNKSLSISLFLQGRLRSDYISHSSNNLESLSSSLVYRIVYSNPQNHSIGLFLSKNFTISTIFDYLSRNKAPGFRTAVNFPVK